jgi:hypothetical protein
MTFHAQASSETALAILGKIMGHNDQWRRVKNLTERGVAEVRAADGFVSITYDWTKEEKPKDQLEMQLDD